MFKGLIIFLGVVNCFLFQEQFELEKGWKRILPISSNRLEVEKIYKKPMKLKYNHALYETDEAVISVEYSDNPCSASEFGKWKVPKDTVLSYSVSLKKGVFLENLIWDKNKFTRRKKNETDRRVTYYNAEENISMYTEILDTGEEVIGTIFYYPAEKFKKLKCKINAT